MLEGFNIIPINCIWAEPAELMRDIKAMKDESEPEWVYAKSPLDLKSIYFPAPPKGGAHLPRFVIWRPLNMTFGSVLVSNYEDGLIQLVRHLNRRFRVSYFSAYLARDHN